MLFCHTSEVLWSDLVDTFAVLIGQVFTAGKQLTTIDTDNSSSIISGGQFCSKASLNARDLIADCRVRNDRPTRLDLFSTMPTDSGDSIRDTKSREELVRQRLLGESIQLGGWENSKNHLYKYDRTFRVETSPRVDERDANPTRLMKHSKLP